MQDAHKHEGRGLREIAEDGTFTDVCPCGATQKGKRSPEGLYKFDAWEEEQDGEV